MQQSVSAVCITTRNHIFQGDAHQTRIAKSEHVGAFDHQHGGTFRVIGMDYYQTQAPECCVLTCRVPVACALLFGSSYFGLSANSSIHAFYAAFASIPCTQQTGRAE